MKNKLLTLFLALAASVGTLFAQSGTCGTNLTWTIQSGILAISGTGAMKDYTYSSSKPNTPWYSYRESITSVVISDGVASIGTYAFYDCSSLTSITIPSSVTSIGLRAFRGCSSLTSLTIGESVTSIGSSAFSGCSKLATVIWNAKKCNDFSSSNTPFYYYESSSSSNNFDLRTQITSFTFGDNVESIPAYLCSGMSNLTSITIPNSVTSIGEGAFYGCSGLTSVTIPNSVTSIGNGAFEFCSGLTSITIPNSVTSIGASAFNNCSSLASVTIGESVTSIGDYAFIGCSKLATVIWNAKKCNNFSFYNTPFYHYNGSNSSGNFDLRKQITSFTFGDNVESIPAYLCSGMSNLTAITIPNSVTSIGEGAFYGCSGLTSVTIPNSVTSIGNGAFEFCSSLTSITIPSSVTSIGLGAFADCSSLTSITIPNSVTSIGNSAFYGCSKLIAATIGESVTSIGDYAFKGCSKLATVIWNAKKINDFSSSNTPFYYYNSGSNSSYNFDLRKQITSFTFGDNVESIPAYLCSGMSNLTTITIPNSVTSIGEGAFYGCSSLTSVTIPNSVTSIGGYAFYICTYLEDITIGSSINVDYGIGQKAFYGCRYLLSVTCKAVFPPVINAEVFEGCGVLGGVDLYVPEKSVKRYKKAAVWSEFNIVGKDLSVDDPTNPTNPESGKYTITWQDEDGNILKTDEVTQGTTPAFTGTTPTKEGYDFAGWLPNIKPATEDTKYTTYFIPTQQQESKVYTININGENCSLNINNQYPEGTVITLEAVADECFEFQQWSDGNKDNPRTVTVTKDMNITAEFNKLRYTITGEVDSSKGGKVQIIKK